MRRFRQVIKSSRVKGGARSTFCVGENHGLANFLFDAVAVVFLGEKPGQAMRLDFVGDVFRIVSGPRGVDGIAVQVGAENLHVKMRWQAIEPFLQQDRQRVGFLARGATRNPYPEGGVAWPGGKELGLNRLGQRLEGFCIAKEMSDTDQQLAEKHIQFRGVLAQVVKVLLRPLEFGGC